MKKKQFVFYDDNDTGGSSPSAPTAPVVATPPSNTNGSEPTSSSGVASKIAAFNQGQAARQIAPRQSRQQNVAPANKAGGQQQQTQGGQQKQEDVETPLGNAIQSGAKDVNNAFAQMRTPMGLLGAFILLFAVIWLLLPTKSGYTRASLLWKTLLGTTDLTSTPQLSPQEQQSTVSQLQGQSQTIATGVAGALGQGQGPSPEQVAGQTAPSPEPVYIHQDFDFME